MKEEKKVGFQTDFEDPLTLPPWTIWLPIQSIFCIILKKHVKGSIFCTSQIHLNINHAIYLPKSLMIVFHQRSLEVKPNWLSSIDMSSCLWILEMDGVFYPLMLIIVHRQSPVSHPAIRNDKSSRLDPLFNLT